MRIFQNSSVPGNDSAPEAVGSQTTRVIVSRYALDMFIGVHDFEKLKPQRVVVSVEASVAPDPHWRRDDIARTLNYETIINAIREIAATGHINLVETFAEYIADFCLSDRRVVDVKVRVEKPEIVTAADAVAVEIFRVSATTNQPGTTPHR